MISCRNIHQFLHGPLWGCGGQCGPVQAVSQAGSVLASIHSPFSLRRRYLPFRTVYFFLRMMMDIWPGLHLTTWMISFLHYFSKAESTHIILCQLTRILRGIKNIKLSPNSGPGGLLEYLAVPPPTQHFLGVTVLTGLISARAPCSLLPREKSNSSVLVT